MKRGDPEYAPDRRFDALVAFLFPVIADELGLDPQTALAEVPE